MLAYLVPGPLVRAFARPYLAGTTAEAAIATAVSILEDHGRLTTLDLLGESVQASEQVSNNEHTYLNLIEAIHQQPQFEDSVVRPSISLKPSAFTISGPDAAFVSIRRIVQRADAHKIPVTIDMEDRCWTDITLQKSVELFNEGYDVGTVLQSRLYRTQEDIKQIPPGMRVRLVIGIYPEPKEVALTCKADMKVCLVDYAEQLLDAGVRVELATHDAQTLRRFVSDVAPKAPERCELQLLLGVPREPVLRDIRADPVGGKLPVRLYVPFATSGLEATAYLRRRLAENPNMALLVLRNLLG